MNNVVFPQDCPEPIRTRWNAECTELIGSSADAALIEACAASFCFSSHLHRLSRHFSTDIPKIWAGEIDQICEDAYRVVDAQAGAQPEAFGKAISYFRNRCHFAIACGELWGKISFEHSLSMLSRIAEQAVDSTAAYLVRSAGLTDSQWIILALGKLGAEELNYSSDLDLICLFDMHPHADDADDAASQYIHLTKELVSLLSTSTEYGAGWRIDLRLRPAPSATAICLSVPAAISYYESQARSWERAAFIRARPIAGNIAHGRQFLTQIDSFIWRRSLDYTIIDDLAVMLQHKSAPEDYLGFDVKKGSYGIRHIELFCHILQLLAGGRHPEARSHNTATAMAALAEIGWLEGTQAGQLTSAYFGWRSIEHRLQYWQDAHTHSLPRQLEELEKFAAFAGFHLLAEFTAHLEVLRQNTQKFSTHPVMSRALHLSRSPDNQSTIAGNTDHEALCQQLADMGFVRAEDIAHTVNRWQEGQIAATRSDKARQNLGRMLPRFLAEISHAYDADDAFFAFARMIEKLNAGAQLFALFAEHPELGKLVAESIGKSPMIADFLSEAPDLLDLLLETSFFTPLAERADSLIHLPLLSTANPDIESRLEQVRMYKRESDFTASMHILHGFSAIDDVQILLSSTADTALELMCQAATEDIIRQFGDLASFSFAVIALGRLGTRNLALESDLDLVFLFSDGAPADDRPPHAISAKAYATKLAQRITNFMTVKTAHGSLYQLDLRLRPDGNSGALAVPFERLESYFTEQAWPWEKLSFRKARLVYAYQTPDWKQPQNWHAGIIAKLQQYFMQDDLASLVDDIHKMRKRVQAGAPPASDLKKRAGGFLDAEFLVGLEAHPDMAVTGTAQSGSPVFINALNTLERIKQSMPVYGISPAGQHLEYRTEQEISDMLAPATDACAEIKDCLENALDTAQTLIDAR